jgi:hypothetical protein
MRDHDALIEQALGVGGSHDDPLDKHTHRHDVLAVRSFSARCIGGRERCPRVPATNDLTERLAHVAVSGRSNRRRDLAARRQLRNRMCERDDLGLPDTPSLGPHTRPTMRCAVGSSSSGQPLAHRVILDPAWTLLGRL